MQDIQYDIQLLPNATLLVTQYSFVLKITFEARRDKEVDLEVD